MARRCLMVYIVAGWLCCFRTSVVSQINVRKRKRRRKRKQRSLNKFAENTGDGTGGGFSDHSMYIGYPFSEGPIIILKKGNLVRYKQLPSDWVGEDFIITKPYQQLTELCSMIVL